MRAPDFEAQHQNLKEQVPSIGFVLARGGDESDNAASAFASIDVNSLKLHEPLDTLKLQKRTIDDIRRAGLEILKLADDLEQKAIIIDHNIMSFPAVAAQ